MFTFASTSNDVELHFAQLLNLICSAVAAAVATAQVVIELFNSN